MPSSHHTTLIATQANSTVALVLLRGALSAVAAATCAVAAAAVEAETQLPPRPSEI